MNQAPTASSRGFSKALTGITGLNEMTDGGLPRGRTTLLAGGPGSGKTILSLQFLVHGARECNEPGIFVAFEEASERIVANANGFGWDIPYLQDKKALYFLNAQPAPDPCPYTEIRFIDRSRQRGWPRLPCALF
ncbi:AAA family ATPase [Pseudoduganella sp. LjRoot289]|uniref:ATPase domain-containing protein n=1 Tax=Pseudoduganella sp. LjRoot289 TaxID=3342314 RepID=UPI003ED0AD19